MNNSSNQNQFNQMLAFQQRQAIALERIADLLERSLPRQAAPEYESILEGFNSFNWDDIGAKITSKDSYGVSSVTWQGRRFLRRSPSNSYGAAIFFSNCIGKDGTGKNCYERLITFRPKAEIKIEPISRKAEAIVRKND